jgi:DNA gyrase subunit B
VGSHEQKLKDQFSIRVSTFNQAANWMLSPELIAAHVRAAGGAGSNKKILDLCCGTGIVGKAFLKAGWHVEGIDITPEMAQETCKSFSAIASSVEKMPFADGSFDAAVLRQSYMLLDGPKALGEIGRVIRKGGQFVLSQSVAFGADDEEQYIKVQKARHINMLRYYSTQDLVDELKANGFSVLKKDFLRVRENSSQWMKRAPELKTELKEQIVSLIRNAPEPYRRVRNVSVENGEVFEDWNWVILTAVNET